MGGNCSTEPFDSQSANVIVSKLTETTASTNALLTEISTKLTTLTTAQQSCCESLGTKMDSIVNKLGQIIDKL